MEFTAIDMIEIIGLSTISFVYFNIIRDTFKEAEHSIGDYIIQGAALSIVILLLLIKIIHIYNDGILKNKEDSQYVQKIAYSISSKEIVREKDKITYRLNFKIENSFIFNNKDIYITKEEYDLLKKSDEISFIFNTKTKSIRLDEEKFNDLIEELKMKRSK